MTPAEKHSAEVAGAGFRQIPAGDLRFADGYWRGAGFALCKVAVVSSAYPRGARVELVDAAGNDVGMLYCLKDELVENDADLSDVEYVAFIADIQPANLGKPYRFAADYAAVDEAHFDEYRVSYGNTAPLWGGFVHADFMSVGIPTAHTIAPPSILLRDKLRYPTSYHESCSIRSVIQASGIERFLKLYHLLELVFDWDFVQQIKTLGDDLAGIGKVLKQLSSKEIAALQSVISERCSDFDTIAEKMSAVRLFKADAKKLFYEFDKDSNPFKDWNSFETHFCNIKFDRTVYDTSQFPRNQKTFEVLVGAIAAYWIYRFRCSIAHHRIGEYILTENDEKFVVEFGEPLLREIVCQAFGRTRSTGENFARWKASEMPRFWVESRQGDWDHRQWVALLETLERSDYWPMDTNQVGALLEDLKLEYQARI